MNAPKKKGNDALRATLVASNEGEATGDSIVNDKPRPLFPHEKLRKLLQTNRADLLAMLVTEDAVRKFISVCSSAVMDRPELMGADSVSLIIACKQAASDGLMPDGREAVLNIYPTKIGKGDDAHWIKKVQYLPMVAGIVKKFYEAGAAYVDAAAVFEKDSFRFIRGDETSIVHEPTMEDEPGKIVAAYAIVRFANGEIKREVMFRRDLRKVRQSSKTGKYGPWTDWEDQMSIKSVLHRINKQMPRSNDHLQKVLDSDNAAMGYIDNPPAPDPQKSLTNEPSESIASTVPDETENPVPVEQAEKTQ